MVPTGAGRPCSNPSSFDGTRPGRSSSIGSKFENFFPLFAALSGISSHKARVQFILKPTGALHVARYPYPGAHYDGALYHQPLRFYVPLSAPPALQRPQSWPRSFSQGPDGRTQGGDCAGRPIPVAEERGADHNPRCAGSDAGSCVLAIGFDPSVRNDLDPLGAPPLDEEPGVGTLAWKEGRPLSRRLEFTLVTFL